MKRIEKLNTDLIKLREERSSLEKKEKELIAAIAAEEHKELKRIMKMKNMTFVQVCEKLEGMNSSSEEGEKMNFKNM